MIGIKKLGIKACEAVDGNTGITYGEWIIGLGLTLVVDGYNEMILF